MAMVMTMLMMMRMMKTIYNSEQHVTLQAMVISGQTLK